MVATNAEAFGKLVKGPGKIPSELEKQIAQAMSDLSSSTEIKGQMNELYFVGAQVGGGNMDLYAIANLQPYRSSTSERPRSAS